MNIYEKRWAKVYNFAKKLKDLYDTGNYVIIDEDGMVPTEFTIKLDNDEQYFGLKSHNTSYMIYDGDLDWDDGAYDTIAVTMARLSKIKLFKLEEVVL
jgi:hypothetical protein